MRHNGQIVLPSFRNSQGPWPKWSSSQAMSLQHSQIHAIFLSPPPPACPTCKALGKSAPPLHSNCAHKLGECRVPAQRGRPTQWQARAAGRRRRQPARHHAHPAPAPSPPAGPPPAASHRRLLVFRRPVACAGCPAPARALRFELGAPSQVDPHGSGRSGAC